MAFDPTKLGAFYRYNWVAVSITVAGAKQLLQANPYRVAFGCTVNGAVATIGPQNFISSSVGLAIPNSANPLVLSLANVGTLVQQEWWGFASSVPDTFTVFEVLWTPPSE